MKPYFQGMITGGSLMITFFVLTASQIPIAEDSGTFNTLNVETINVSKSININDKIMIYQDEEGEDNGIVFFDENGSRKMVIAHGKELHGVFLNDDNEKLKMGLGVFNNKPTIQFFDNDKVRSEITEDYFSMTQDGKNSIVFLGYDEKNNGLLQLSENIQYYKTLHIGHDENSNGMILIRNNSKKETFYLGHDIDNNGVLEIRNRYGNRTHRKP